MAALNLKLIFSFIILVCCQTSFAVDENAPEWVSKPPTQDTQYWYFVGRSSGDVSEDKLYEQAYENAKISAIRELFGIATEVSSQSYEALTSSTSVNRVNESSRKVILKGFQKSDQYLKANSLWVLYRYSKASAKAELSRLESNISKDQPVEFSELNATSSNQSGILEIVTSPNDVTVTVDNQSYGIAPIRLKLTEGTHTVMLDHPYYERIEEQVVVKTGDVTKLNKILVRAKRKIIINTSPEQATVELGGKYLGTSPIETAVVAEERLTVLVTHPETLPLKTEVMIGKGNDIHKLELPPLTLKPSFLSVNSVPQGAEVFIGKKKIGHTPTGFFETRNTTVTIRKDGYKEYEKFVVLKGGEKQVLPTVNLISISEEEKRRAEYESQLLEYLYSSPIIITLGLGYAGETMKDTNAFVSLNGSVEKKIYGWAGIRLGIASRSSESKKERGNGTPNTSETYVAGVQATEYSLSVPIYLSNGWYLAPEAGTVSGKVQQVVRTYSPLGIDSDGAPYDTNFQQTFFGAAVGRSSFERNLNPLGWYWEVGIKNYTDSGDFKGSSSINGKIGIAYRF